MPIGVLLGAICVSPLLGGGDLMASPRDSSVFVKIRRTSYGIPHILAHNERGLGYGIGYAYAEDNICLLADEVVTVKGERSFYFGPDSSSNEGIKNLASDFFFQWLNRRKLVHYFWEVQRREIRDLLIGYAAGYNQYLRTTGLHHLPAACRDQTWVRPISTADLVRVTRRLTVESGLAKFVSALVAASPPKAEHAKSTLEQDHQVMSEERNFIETRGSNAIALGSSMTQNGRGILLGNPHFPWSGPLRFYEMHLTIPKKLNVMGAALPGMPLINIGFTRNVAWSHTVDSSAHFTFYRLRLDSQKSTSYIVDGRRFRMRQISVSVAFHDQRGSLKRKTHTFFETRFGPIVIIPDRFDWNLTRAFTLRDANLDNTRSLAQWYAIDKASNLRQFEKAITQVLGIPWVTTVAADSKGRTLFMNVSVIPNVKVSACRWPSPEAVSENRFVILDGSKSFCDWQILPAKQLPILRRDDYVQNSNNSAWMTNPSNPLKGFSPLISRAPTELNGRTLYALNWLEGRKHAIESQKASKIETKDIENLLMDDKVYLASLTIDGIIKLCTQPLPSQFSAVERGNFDAACLALEAWDGTANASASIGYIYFDRFMSHAFEIQNLWAVPGISTQPLRTPRSLNVNSPDVANALRVALIQAANEVSKFRLPTGTTWGQIQIAYKNGRNIPVHGGRGSLGVYNVIQDTPYSNGHLEAYSGSSYVQIVSFKAKGPMTKAILTFSESSDPASRHYADQTELFSQKQWVELPFAEAAIRQDPNYSLTILRARHTPRQRDRSHSID